MRVCACVAFVCACVRIKFAAAKAARDGIQTKVRISFYFPFLKPEKTLCCCKRGREFSCCKVDVAGANRPPVLAAAKVHLSLRRLHLQHCRFKNIAAKTVFLFVVVVVVVVVCLFVCFSFYLIFHSLVFLLPSSSCPPPPPPIRFIH